LSAVEPKAHHPKGQRYAAATSLRICAVVMECTTGSARSPAPRGPGSWVDRACAFLVTRVPPFGMPGVLADLGLLPRFPTDAGGCAKLS
jgi:hypothetical protein